MNLEASIWIRTQMPLHTRTRLEMLYRKVVTVGLS